LKQPTAWLLMELKPISNEAKEYSKTLLTLGNLGIALWIVISALCYTAAARLQFLLLLQNLHNGVRETSRFVLWKRLHGRRRRKRQIQDFVCFSIIRYSSNSLSRSFHNAGVCRNQDYGVSAPIDSPVLQRQQKTAVAKLLVFHF